MHACPSAVVIDTGSFSTKIGFSGSEEPQSVVRTAAGIIDHNDNHNTKHHTNKFDDYFIDSSLNPSNKSKIERMEIKLPYQTGTVLDMQCLAAIWMNTMRQKLRMTESQISSTPILLSTPSFWSNSSMYSSLFSNFRQDYCRTIFEDFNSPALYLCKDAVLSSFAHAQKSCIVLDLGFGSTRCTPIYDGFVINNGFKLTKCGGHYLDHLLTEKLTKQLKYTQKYPSTDSYREYMKSCIISDVKETVFKIRNTQFDVPNLPFPYKTNDSYKGTDVLNKYEAPFKVDEEKEKENEIQIKVEPTIKLEQDIDIKMINNGNIEYIYTLPDGEKIQCGEWQYYIPEVLFMDYDKRFESDLEDEWIIKQLQTTQNTTQNNYYQNTQHICNDKDYKPFRFKGLGSMVIDSLNGCDIDIRSLCIGNVIVCGGHSRYKGFIERLSKELSCCMPYSYKYRLHYGDSPRERLFTPWIGGSVLSSTTNIQSMWITKEEYSENGANIVHRKCF